MASGSDVDSTQVCGDIFCEFMEVAIHTILYMRDIYPAGAFERRKKYSVPVQICQHPDVYKYIVKVVEGIQSLQANNQVEKVVVVVMTKELKPLERFVFEISTPLHKISGIDKYLFRLEDSLRAFLLRLNVCDSMLKTTSQDKTWTVHVHTKESAASRLNEQAIQKKFPWVEVDEAQMSLEKPNLVPLKGMDSDIFKMQLYVEEADIKDTG